LINGKKNGQQKMSGIGEKRKFINFLAIPKELAFSLKFVVAPLDKCPTNLRLTLSPTSQQKLNTAGYED
jgi:hypothetical protein